MQSSFSVVSHQLLTRLNPEGKHEVAYLAQFWYGQPQDEGAYIIVPFHSADHLIYYLEKLKPELFAVYQSPSYLQHFKEWHAKKIKETSKLIVYVPIEGIPICTDVPLIDQADLILVPSKFSQNCLRRHGYKSEVLYHGVDTRIFKPKRNWRRKFKHPNPFRFGQVASHVPRKQITRVIDAYNLTRLKGYNSTLRIYASTYDAVPWMPRLDKYIQRTRSNAQISETAKLNLAVSPQTIAKFYNLIHCHLLPSSESFGLPNLEAMACGTIPILVRHGGAPEIVRDCGLYAEIESFLTTSMGNFAMVSRKSLAEVMIWAMENPPALEKIAEKAIRVAKKFTWSKPVQKLRKLLEGLL